uniref:Putative secreted peptide n=1 Tax=Anopheles braziliensis TaxID=58242 RepID=A0A2M3ZRL5_9DIPT
MQFRAGVLKSWCLAVPCFVSCQFCPYSQQLLKKHSPFLFSLAGKLTLMAMQLRMVPFFALLFTYIFEMQSASVYA